jgi:hypothetical protein
VAEQERPPDPAAKRADGFERLRQRFVAGLPRRWREIDEASDDAARRRRCTGWPAPRAVSASSRWARPQGRPSRR